MHAFIQSDAGLLLGWSSPIYPLLCTGKRNLVLVSPIPLFSKKYIYTFLGKTKISFSLRVRYVQPECHVLAVSVPSLP